MSDTTFSAALTQSAPRASIASRLWLGVHRGGRAAASLAETVQAYGVIEGVVVGGVLFGVALYAAGEFGLTL